MVFGKFGYSINDTDSSANELTTNLSSGNYTTGSNVWSDVNFEPDLSASVSTGAETIMVH